MPGLILFSLLSTAAGADVAAPAGYALRDGDVVVFLGDSITAARTYGKIIENYTLLRFPARKVRFINSGHGGDTMAGGLARLDRDVFQRGATAVVVAFGTNDIGWGVWADDAHKKKYLDAVRGLVKACRERKVRVYLCSAAVTAQDPEKSEAGFLQKMCDEGMQIARAEGEHAIDVQRSMRDIQKRVAAYNAALKGEKGKVSLHLADGAHLTDLGQMAMAFAILKGLGAPAEVSSAVVDAADAKVLEARGCQVTDVKAATDGVAFTRLDEGRPINFGLFGALNFRFVPVHQELNRYLVAVKNLKEGKYELRVDDRKVGVYTHQQLAAGLNIASATPDAWQPGGPWDAEATVLSRLTEARSDLGVSRQLLGLYLPKDARRPDLDARNDKINAALEDLQRALVRPTPYHFTVRPAEAK